MGESVERSSLPLWERVRERGCRAERRLFTLSPTLSHRGRGGKNSSDRLTKFHSSRSRLNMYAYYAYRKKDAPMKTEYDFSKAKRTALLSGKGKTRITIFIDDAVLDEFRARAEKAGSGYQTMVNDALKAYIADTDSQPVTEAMLRRILREEIPTRTRSTKQVSRRSHPRPGSR